METIVSKVVDVYLPGLGQYLTQLSDKAKLSIPLGVALVLYFFKKFNKAKLDRKARIKLIKDKQHVLSKSLERFKVD